MMNLPRKGKWGMQIKRRVMKKLSKWDKLVLQNGNFENFERNGVKNRSLRWSLKQTSFGRTGVINMAGIDIGQFVMMLKGNLALGGPIVY